MSDVIKIYFLQKLVKTQLKDHMKNAYKSKVAIAYVKKSISTFRTEERRRVDMHNIYSILYVIQIYLQVLGLPPYDKIARLSSDAMADAMIRYFKASSSSKQCYLKNLTFLISD